MADPIHLSFWLRDAHTLTTPLFFRKLLERFPFSKLNASGVLRVYAISHLEPPMMEHWLDDQPDPTQLVSLAEQFLHEDVAFELETYWDLWQWDSDWQLRPSRITIDLFGPSFDRELGETLRIDAGSDFLYLPHPKSDQLRPVQSNIRSILHLASDIEDALPVTRKLLWSDSEENFADRLREMLD
jgi:hypothetical protein